MSWLKIIVFLFMYLGYLLFGMIVFHNTEFECFEVANDTQIANLDSPQADSIRTLAITKTLTAIKDNDSTVRDTSNNHEKLIICTNWDKWEAFFFSFITITTIGYGNIAPKTPNGKIFCIIYSLFGICINVILIERLEKFYKRLMKSFRRKLYEIFLGDDPSFDYTTLSQYLRIGIIIVIHIILGLGIFLFLPSVIFYVIENPDTYLDGVYFNFITMTTIGFGDHVPGKDKVLTELGNWRYLYFCGLIIWILNGLGFFLMTINVIKDAMKIPAKRLKRKMSELEEGNSNRILNAVIKIYLSKQGETAEDNTDNDSSNADEDFMANMNQQTVRFLREIVLQTVQILRGRNTEDKKAATRDENDGSNVQSLMANVLRNKNVSDKSTAFINGKRIALSPKATDANNDDTYLDVLEKRNNGARKKGGTSGVQFSKAGMSKDRATVANNDDTYLDVLEKRHHDARKKEGPLSVQFSKGELTKDLVFSPRRLPRAEETLEGPPIKVTSSSLKVEGRFQVQKVAEKPDSQSSKQGLPDNLLSITLKEIIEAVESIEENNR